MSPSRQEIARPTREQIAEAIGEQDAVVAGEDASPGRFYLRAADAVLALLPPADQGHTIDERLAEELDQYGYDAEHDGPPVAFLLAILEDREHDRNRTIRAGLCVTCWDATAPIGGGRWSCARCGSIYDISMDEVEAPEPPTFTLGQHVLYLGHSGTVDSVREAEPLWGVRFDSEPARIVHCCTADLEPAAPVEPQQENDAATDPRAGLHLTADGNTCNDCGEEWPCGSRLVIDAASERAAAVEGEPVDTFADQVAAKTVDEFADDDPVEGEPERPTKVRCIDVTGVRSDLLKLGKVYEVDGWGQGAIRVEGVWWDLFRFEPVAHPPEPAPEQQADAGLIAELDIACAVMDEDDPAPPPSATPSREQAERECDHLNCPGAECLFGPDEPEACGCANPEDRVQCDEPCQHAGRADEWWLSTASIRSWVNGEGAPTYPLVRQLAVAFASCADSPAEALRLLAEAIDAAAVRTALDPQGGE